MKNKIKYALLSLTLAFSSLSQADRLEDIQKTGRLRVGTTGDYTPFSLNENGTFSGYDIDVAKFFAKKMGVELIFVPTTWSNLLTDLEQNKYDIAMGGITRRIERQLRAEQSQGYMVFGKCFLVAKGRTELFNSLEKANQATTRVGVNIGGTNEIFADAHLAKANFTRYKNNLDVPEAVALNKVDLMVTETPEALYYQAIDKRLEAVGCSEPYTKADFGYLVPKGEQRLLNTVNFLMDEIKLTELDKKLRAQNQLVE